MDTDKQPNDNDVPAEVRDRLNHTMAQMPRTWRVAAIYRTRGDWAVDLAGDSGEVIAQIVLLGPRSPDETHSAQPRTDITD